MHSFAMTRNYLILTEFPMFLKPAAGLLWGRAPKDSMEWMPVEGTRFLVLNKRSGKLEALHHSSAMFAFHHINAYERDDEIVLDIAATDEPTLLRKSQLTSLRQATLRADHPLSQFRRYRLPLRCGTRTLEPEIICDQLVEMVTINTDAVSGRRHRYCYGVGHNTAWQGLAGQLVKVDVKRGSIRTWLSSIPIPTRRHSSEGPMRRRRTMAYCFRLSWIRRKRARFCLSWTRARLASSGERTFRIMCRSSSTVSSCGDDRATRSSHNMRSPTPASLQNLFVTRSWSLRAAIWPGVPMIGLCRGRLARRLR